MSWWEAFVWGTLIVAVLLGLLIAGYYSTSRRPPSGVAAAGEKACIDYFRGQVSEALQFLPKLIAANWRGPLPVSSKINALAAPARDGLSPKSSRKRMSSSGVQCRLLFCAMIERAVDVHYSDQRQHQEDC